MFTLDELTLPIIAAPMAGGASTPELVAAVNAAGGLGWLAAGYKSAAAMTEQISATRKLTDRPFGVNLFVPAASDPAALADLPAYRAELLPEAERWDIALPERITPDDEDWAAKIAALLADPVPVLSYTFALPTRQEADALRAVGTAQVATVTSVAEALAAAELGLDALCVQGPEAGGHRGTHAVTAAPGTERLLDVPLLDLLALVRAAVDLPLIAAGGLGDGPGSPPRSPRGPPPSNSARPTCSPTRLAPPLRTAPPWPTPPSARPSAPGLSPAGSPAACGTPSPTGTPTTLRTPTPRCTTSPPRCGPRPPGAGTPSTCTCGPGRRSARRGPGSGGADGAAVGERTALTSMTRREARRGTGRAFLIPASCELLIFMPKLTPLCSTHTHQTEE